MRVSSADQLELCEEVGKGAFGVVYRGHLVASGDEVAVKQIDLENDPSDLLDVLREIQIISECRLPQITSFYGCFVKNYQLWVVMEFADGGSLFDVLRPGPITSEPTIALILCEVLLALEYLHDQGKIHRDLKSQNILLTKSGSVKLTDFGVSVQLSSNFSRRNTTVGTPYWMAPEVILNSDGHSFKADLWSLGCCAYELATGKPPLQKDYPPMRALRHISSCTSDSDFADLIHLASLDVSPEFHDFMRNCFVVDPSKRYSAQKLLKHPFITHVSLPPEEQAMLIKTVIANKQRWDQEHHIGKTRNFYLSSNIDLRQDEWKRSESPTPNQAFPIQFDFSTMKVPETGSKVSTSSLSSPPRSKHVDLERVVGVELSKVLKRAVYRLESRTNLTPEQLQQLESINYALVRLLVVGAGSERSESNNGRLIAVQYLRYIFKEIAKETSDSARLLLQRLILPSSLGSSKPSLENLTTKRYTSQYDEIEASLLESWVEKMSQR